MTNTLRLSLILTIVSFFSLGMLLAPTPDITPHQKGDTLRIEEDDPRWDCNTMGNRICGPNAS